MELFCEGPFFAASNFSVCVPLHGKGLLKSGIFQMSARHFLFLFFFHTIFDMLRTTLGLLVVNPIMFFNWSIDWIFT